MSVQQMGRRKSDTPALLRMMSSSDPFATLRVRFGDREAEGEEDEERLLCGVLDVCAVSPMSGCFVAIVNCKQSCCSLSQSYKISYTALVDAAGGAFNIRVQGNSRQKGFERLQRRKLVFMLLVYSKSRRQ
jgi:hypothetical protein